MSVQLADRRRSEREREGCAVSDRYFRPVLYPLWAVQRLTGPSENSQSIGSSDVVDASIETSSCAPSRISRQARSASVRATGAPLRLVQGSAQKKLGEIVLQFQGTFLCKSHGPRLGILFGPEAGKGLPHPVGDRHMFSSGCLGFQQPGPRGQHIDRGIDLGSRAFELVPSAIAGPPARMYG